MKKKSNPPLNHGRRPRARPARLSPEANSFPVVGIGASAGGLEAFTQLLHHLPLDTGMAFVLIQHLDPNHESALVDLLSRATAMPVREAANQVRVQANQVYVIPPNASMTLHGGRLELALRKRNNGVPRCIDLFLESLAKDRGDLAIGVILSGTASDGTAGLEAVKAEGGITFAQDGSAKYESMPRSAIAADCVDFVLSSPRARVSGVDGAQHPRQSRPAAAGVSCGTGSQLARKPNRMVGLLVVSLPPGSRQRQQPGSH